MRAAADASHVTADHVVHLKAPGGIGARSCTTDGVGGMETTADECRHYHVAVRRQFEADKINARENKDHES